MSGRAVLTILAALGATTMAMLVIVAAGWSPRVEYVLALGLVVVVAVVRVHRLTRSVALPVWPLPRRPVAEPPGVDPRVSAIETAFRRGTEAAGACRRRVQPLLVELAIHRLARHHGIGLVEDPEGARRLLGDEPFEFLTHVVDEPPSAATLARTVDAIEAL